MYLTFYKSKPARKENQLTLLFGKNYLYIQKEKFFFKKKYNKNI